MKRIAWTILALGALVSACVDRVIELSPPDGAALDAVKDGQAAGDGGGDGGAIDAPSDGDGGVGDGGSVPSD